MNSTPPLSTSTLRGRYLLLATAAFYPILASVAVAAESTVDIRARAMSARYAAMQTLSVAASEVNRDNLGAKLAALHERMLDDVPAHRERAKSEKIAADWAVMVLEKDVQRIVTQVWQKFQLQEVGVSEQVFSKDVNQKLGARFAAERQNVLQLQFGKIYADARSAAILEQRKAFTAAGFPSQEEADRLDDQGWDSAFGKQTLERLGASIKRSTPIVFEENEPEISRMVKAVRDSIDLQLKAQVELLSAVELPDSMASKEGAKAEFERALKAWLAAERARSLGAPVYEPFPSTRRKIVELADAVELQRFVAFLEGHSPSINADGLRARIRGNPSAFRQRAESQQRLGKELLGGAGAEAVQTYSAKPKAQTDMVAFRQRLGSYLKGGPAEAALWNAVLGRLSAVLDEIRNEIATEQFNRHFATLARRTWAVPESHLKGFAENRSGVSSFEQSMKLPDINHAGAPVAGGLLPETEDKVLAEVGKLIEEGKRAWGEQEIIVKRKADPIHREMTEAAQRQQLVEKETWVLRYTELVQGEWAETRVKVLWRSGEFQPENVGTKYSPLFEETRKQIRRNVSDFYDSAENPRMPVVQPAPEPMAPPQQATIASPTAPQAAPTNFGPSVAVRGDRGSSGDGVTGSGHPGNAGDQPHPNEGSMLVPLIWWAWLLLVLLIVLAVAFAIWWGRRKIKASNGKAVLAHGWKRLRLGTPERNGAPEMRQEGSGAVLHTLSEFLGPFDVRKEKGTLSFRCRDKPEVWVLTRATQ